MAKDSNIKKERIIDAAIKVMTEKSVEEATVREIAERAGVTTGSIYHYYKNKEELLYDVINHSIHFVYKISEVEDSKTESKEEFVTKIQSEVARRLSKIEEQKLHLTLISDVISKGGYMKEKCKTNYINIIHKTADVFCRGYGLENKKFETAVLAILVAALDGVAVQQALGVLPEEQDKFIKLFNDFFTESIPAFLERHKEEDK